MESAVCEVTVLPRERWQALQEQHRARVEPWVRPHLERRRSGRSHPVEDFLFTYYTYSPAALQRWHPGYGTVLEDAAEFLGRTGYAPAEARSSGAGVTGAGVRGAGVSVSTSHLRSRLPVLRSVRALVQATLDRPAFYGCFGMHEWAMVYRTPSDEVRHARWPLRLGAEGTDAVVESHRIACSHFDAFRFFADAARPRNAVQPRADTRTELEQPGCLHAGMDVYRHAHRLSPLVPATLVADSFALARDIRALDMRASPYDLRALDDGAYPPVPVETPEGKQEYAAAQRRFAVRAQRLRARLLAECDRLLSSADRPPDGPAGR